MFAGRAAWTFVVCMGWASLTLAQSVPVTVITRTPQDIEVKDKLSLWLDVPVIERAEPITREPDAIVADAEHADAQGYLVVLDRRNALVRVIRPSDHTAVVRALPADVMRDSQYAVALSAAEMLEWLGAQAHADAPTPGATHHATHADRPEAPTRHAGLAGLLGIDAELRDSPGFDVNLLRPSLHAELQWRPEHAEIWFAFGARTALAGSWHRQLGVELAHSGVQRIDYANTDGALTLALGHDTQGTALRLELSAGLSAVQVHARDATEKSAGRDSSVSGFFGGGVGLRYPLAWGLALDVGAEAQWLLEPTRYRVTGLTVLQEGGARIAARVGMSWQSAFSH